MSNGKWRLFYYLSWFPWYTWTPTFGDGCGNDTGIPVEYDNAVDVVEWHIKNESLQERLNTL
ncbi:hypothetical protein GuL6_090 [Buttiauxella phage vB_ButM_GuL6]|nr:hypothetical protein GuL6_090 [Buttiauxella phage vB_ButM_GuL6]